VSENWSETPKLQVDTGPARVITHFPWRAGKISVLALLTTWSQSRRLLYSIQKLGGQNEIPNCRIGVGTQINVHPANFHDSIFTAYTCAATAQETRA
jgi:hypothetical protein